MPPLPNPAGLLRGVLVVGDFVYPYYRLFLIVFSGLVGLGLWLWLGWWRGAGGWLHAKTALVAILVVYHWHCGRVLQAFRAGTNAKSHVWFRFYNELPVVVLLIVLFLVVLKPF